MKRDHALAAVLASSFLFCLAGPARADLAIIGLTGGVPEATGVDAEVGWQFSLNADVRVTALGVYDHERFTVSGLLRRWRSPGIQL